MVYAPLMYYPSWAGQPIALWTSIEANLALICSCLPTLRPFAVRLLKKLHGSTASKWSLTDFTGKGKTTFANQTGSKSNNTVELSGESNQGLDAAHLMGNKGITIHTSYQVSHAGRTQSESSRYDHSRYVSLIFEELLSNCMILIKIAEALYHIYL